MESVDKADEDKIRRTAKRRGFKLHHSRTPDPLALMYGWHIQREGKTVAQFPDLTGVREWLDSGIWRDTRTASDEERRLNGHDQES